MHAQHLRRLPAGPAAGAHQPFALARAARGHQDQRQGDVGGRIRDNAGGVRHRNPCRTRRRHVDMVIARAEIGQHPCARRRAGKGGGVKAIAQRRHDRVKARQRLCHLALGQGRAAVAEGGVKGPGDGGLGRGSHPAGHEKAHQNSRAPSGTARPGPTSTTAPSASGRPRISTSDRKGPICRGGKLTTAST